MALSTSLHESAAVEPHRSGRLPLWICAIAILAVSAAIYWMLFHGLMWIIRWL